MVKAAYLDLWANNKAVLGILPNAAFYPLFKVLEKDKVAIFDPNKEADKGHPKLGGNGDEGEAKFAWPVYQRPPKT